MLSIMSFLRPVLATFILCTLTSWGAARFQSEFALVIAPSVAVAANTHTTIDATSPAVLAASLPAELQSSTANEAAAEPAMADDPESNLFVAPTQTSLDDAATVWTNSDPLNSSDQPQRSRSTRSAASAATSTQPLFDPPSHPGPNSLSVVTTPVAAASEIAILNDANEFQSIATLGLSALVMENRTVLAENQGDAAVGAIVGAVAAADGEDDAARLDAVPEPSGLGLAALGLTGWLLTRRRPSRVTNI